MVEGNTRRVLGEHSKSVRVTKSEREGGEKSGLCFFLKRFRAIKREV